MESLTQDREGCVGRWDKLLSRLQDVGLKIKPEKCNFFQDRVCYLGYIIDKEGLHTTPEKINAIKKAPAPNM